MFYVKHYGSSLNYFGGYLESALKSTVKEPTERTSHRHDYLCKELANRQHDRFCINQSRYTNWEFMEKFDSSTANNNKRQKVDCDDTVSDLDTIMPDGWTMHKPVFFLTKVGEEWCTHCGKHTFPNAIVYPNYFHETIHHQRSKQFLFMVLTCFCSDYLFMAVEVERGLNWAE